jgi:hypothetical protein
VTELDDSPRLMVARLVGFVLLVLLLLVAFLLLLPWSVVALVGWIAASYLYGRLIRRWDLRRKGYFGGRRVNSTWLYEEVSDNTIRQLALAMISTEPGHTELFVPDDDAWRDAVPVWARDRRREIVHRIAERLKKSDLHWDGA